MLLSWTLGFQLFGLQDWCQELDSPLWGKAAFHHLRPQIDRAKGKRALHFLYLNRILLYDGCFECECSRLSISEVLLLQVILLRN